MPTQSCRHHAAYQLANQQNPTQHLFLQAHNRELAGPLTVSASFARSQNAGPTMQPAPPMAKSSKVATFTSATLSKAATLKNRVLAPTAAAAAYQPGQESLPANRGKLYHIIACTCLGLTSFACLHKNAHMPQLEARLEAPLPNLNIVMPVTLLAVAALSTLPSYRTPTRLLSICKSAEVCCPVPVYFS